MRIFKFPLFNLAILAAFLSAAAWASPPSRYQYAVYDPIHSGSVDIFETNGKAITPVEKYPGVPDPAMTPAGRPLKMLQVEWKGNAKSLFVIDDVSDLWQGDIMGKMGGTVSPSRFSFGNREKVVDIAQLDQFFVLVLSDSGSIEWISLKGIHGFVARSWQWPASLAGSNPSRITVLNDKYFVVTTKSDVVLYKIDQFNAGPNASYQGLIQLGQGSTIVQAAGLGNSLWLHVSGAKESFVHLDFEKKTRAELQWPRPYMPQFIAVDSASGNLYSRDKLDLVEITETSTRLITQSFFDQGMLMTSGLLATGMRPALSDLDVQNMALASSKLNGRISLSQFGAAGAAKASAANPAPTSGDVERICKSFEKQLALFGTRADANQIMDSERIAGLINSTTAIRYDVNDLSDETLAKWGLKKRGVSHFEGTAGIRLKFRDLAHELANHQSCAAAILTPNH